MSGCDDCCSAEGSSGTAVMTGEARPGSMGRMGVDRAVSSRAAALGARRRARIRDAMEDDRSVARILVSQMKLLF